MAQPEPTTQTTTKPEPTTQTTTSEPTGASKFSGTDRSNYSEAKVVCGAFSPAKLRRDLGLPSDSGAVDIAQAWSEKYRPAFRQAVFEGCLAGLPADLAG